MITTRDLREKLATEPLTFIIPGVKANNPRDLEVTVLPTEQLPHKVLVEGIDQYALNPDSELHACWFKGTKQRNAWFETFNREWRFLLRLNWPEIHNVDTEFLYYYQKPVYAFYRRGKYRKDLKGKRKNRRNRIGKIADWSKGPYNKESKFNPHHYHTEKIGTTTITRTYKNCKGKIVTKTHMIPILKKTIIPHKIALETNQRPIERFRYVMDVCTKAVEKVSLNVAKDLIERFEHYDYCTRREYRHFLINQKPKRVVVEKDIYWKEEPHTTKDEEGNITVHKNYLAKVDPKDKIDQEDQMILKAKEHTRRERRDWKHKKRLYDRHSKFQTIIIKPVEDEEPEKFKIRNVIFDYEYGPRFTNGKQMFDKNGEPLMKKIYVGKRYEDVTIVQFPRTTYKTIITKQYPGDLSKKRGIIKKNIELLKKYQAEEQKDAGTAKSE